MSIHLEITELVKYGRSAEQAPDFMVRCGEYEGIVSMGRGMRRALSSWCDNYERWQVVAMGDKDAAK